jgi:HPt (histidine-containing phosphotransfer) domain-containing protein
VTQIKLDQPSNTSERSRVVIVPDTAQGDGSGFARTTADESTSNSGGKGGNPSFSGFSGSAKEIPVPRSAARLRLVGKDDEGRPAGHSADSEARIILEAGRDDLLRRLGGNKILVDTLVEMFPEESAKVFAAMQQSRSNRDAPEVRLHAHTLRGMCRMFGASAAADAAGALETAGARGEIGTAGEEEMLREELGQIVAVVKSFEKFGTT